MRRPASLHQALNRWLDHLEEEALTGAEHFGPLKGAVLPGQRRFSIVLDQVYAAREEELS